MRPHGGWIRTASAFTVVVAALGLAAPPARAFFPPWWPRNPTISDNPSPDPTIFNPPQPPPDPFPPEPPPPRPEPPTDCDPPTGVPEPSTLAAALAGLAAAGWAARRRGGR